MEYIQEGLWVRDLWGYVSEGNDLVHPQPRFLHCAWTPLQRDSLIQYCVRVPVCLCACPLESGWLVDVNKIPFAVVQRTVFRIVSPCPDFMPLPHIISQM
jgi:hypothetical protein